MPLWNLLSQIQAEGVELERRPMGEGAKPNTPLVVEVDEENRNKDINALDIEIPTLTRRVYREYRNLETLDLTQLDFTPVPYRGFSAEEQREIVFKDMTTGEVTHTTVDGQCRCRGLSQRTRLFCTDHHETVKIGQRL